MTDTEKLLLGLLSLVLLVVIVVTIVMLVKKNENFEGDAGPTPCGAVTGWPVCGGVCPNNKHCSPWGNGPGSPHGCDCM